MIELLPRFPPAKNPQTALINAMDRLRASHNGTYGLEWSLTVTVMSSPLSRSIHTDRVKL